MRKLPGLVSASAIAALLGGVGKAPRVKSAPKVYPHAKTPVKNPRVGEQMNAMHDKWMAEQFPSRVRKVEPNPDSITSIKLAHRCHRAVARMMRDTKAVAQAFADPSQSSTI